MTPLAAWMSEASALIEAIDPDDRDHVPFRETDGRRKVTGGRTFYWDEPQRGEAILLNNAATHVAWTVDLVLILESAGRSRTDMRNTVANDTNQVARVFERAIQAGSWATAGLWSVIQDGSPTVERQADGHGDVTITFTFIVETSETV